jgi:hypothetical protein
MLASGVIRPSESPFSALVLLVKKEDCSCQLCVAYHGLNDKMIKDQLPVLVVEELLDELHGATFYTKLDLRFGYHQVLMHPDDVEKTAFHTHQVLFEFLVMPFGLCNAPTTFQAIMNEVLQPFLRRFVLVFFDDILIYNTSWSEHLWHDHLVFEKLQDHHLYLKRSKCFFGEWCVGYLGHVISVDGVAMDEEKVQAVLSWRVPSSVRAVQAFLGLAGYYQRFIREFGSLAAPLTKLLYKERFIWTPEVDATFHALQQAVMTAPILRLPAFNKEFIVECDASGTRIGVILHQGDDVIAFFGRLMAPRHAGLAAYKREPTIASLNSHSHGKLGPCLYVPFQIKERVGDVAYKLDLPPSTRLYDVFHVGLLKPHKGVVPLAQGTLPPTLHGKACPQPAEVIKGHLARGVQELILRWEGQTTTNATWVELHAFQAQFPSFQLEDALVVNRGRDVMTGLTYKRRGRNRAPTVEPAATPAAAPDTAPTSPEVAPTAPIG